MIVERLSPCVSEISSVCSGMTSFNAFDGEEEQTSRLQGGGNGPHGELLWERGVWESTNFVTKKETRLGFKEEETGQHGEVLWGAEVWEPANLLHSPSL